MSNFTLQVCPASIEEDDLIEALLEHSDEQLVNFIIELDQRGADTDFTKKMYKYFSDEMKEIRKYERENK